MRLKPAIRASPLFNTQVRYSHTLRTMPAVLVACGFNANGQLLPFADALERGPSHNIPDDITEPSIVASGDRTANVLFAGWSDTLRRHMIIVSVYFGSNQKGNFLMNHS